MSHGSILLVEAPADDRPMYADFLRENGFSVTEVDSTDAGLTAAPTADLIVTGVRLAGSFDGIELVRRLRDDERTRDTPLIVLTACAFEPEEARAYAAGCDLFLPKPCLPDVLLQEARRLIAGSRALRLKAKDLNARGRAGVCQSEALLKKSSAVAKRIARLRRPKHR